ncbi:hypothetical protein AK812_SmicGene32833 [Symbiodinium microadriaticum]|uniref:Uncharacterized protein n=1 Tax=Symbiodinium microadriaticum TaxID=2951 RepID=A0A1Q9CT71_SYMMI|nr:hypothetical protein AK812_SmicGene32833 [Symbiodinium microadriaticum]
MDTTFVALIPKFPEYGQRAVSHRPSESSQDRGFDQTDFRCDSPFRVAGRCQNFTRRLADICSEEVAVAWDVGDAVVQIKDGADLNELLSKHPVDFCPKTMLIQLRIQATTPLATRPERAAIRSLLVAQIVMVKFYKEWLAAKELQALGSTVRLAATQDDSLMDDFDAKLVPQPRFRQWGWDHDDVFDFMRTFDTMVLPAACLPLILLALMLLVLLARYAENLRMVPLLVHLAAQLKAEAEDGGHCMLLILAGTLVRHLTDENFTVAVVNTGDGLQPGPWLRYHPLRASGEAAVSDATTRVRFCLRACGATEETAAWSQALSAMSRALGSSATCLGAGELAMVRCATVSVARVRLHAMLRAKKIVDRNFRHVACFQRNQQEHERFGEKFRSWELDAVRQLVQRVQEEDVEHLKGQACVAGASGQDTRCFWMQEMKQETKAERDKKALFLSDGEKSGMVRIRKTV